ncbi:MAG: NAD(P)/FAD-dependent oxidoreductase [Pseudomonadota bacterium]
MRVRRRSVLAGITGYGALGGAVSAQSNTTAKVVVVGGGFAGATAARELKRLAPRMAVTLIEANRRYTACPFSNLVIGGDRTIDAQTFEYSGLDRNGVTVVQDRATGVNANTRQVVLSDGNTIPYDRLILSPGIDFRWNALEGYGADAVDAMPHAWKAGEQTLLLRRQLDAMEDGGLVVMAAPAAPYRCPPGPYERASLVAHYLKTRKPRAKLIILDSKDQFSKKPLFLQAWTDLYSDVLEWRGASEDGRVSRVDAAAMTIETDFESFRPDVANVIPPQKAGEIAEASGVADGTGWCPIDPVSFESMLQPNIHVIGDACIAAPMPKSAFAANLQAKICAIQVVRLLADLGPTPTTLANTCYSFLSPDAAVSVTGVYTNDQGAFSENTNAGGTSPLQSSSRERQAEAEQAKDWYRAVTNQAFG